jgi:hypothetical protein
LKVLRTTGNGQFIVKFEQNLEELGRKHKCIIQENLTLFLWKFWWDG